MMYGFNNGIEGEFGMFGGIFMILWWVFIIAVIVALVKWIIYHNFTDSFQDKSALDILKKRYAQGEIDRKEFEEKRKDLLS